MLPVQCNFAKIQTIDHMRDVAINWLFVNVPRVTLTYNFGKKRARCMPECALNWPIGLATSKGKKMMSLLRPSMDRPVVAENTFR